MEFVGGALIIALGSAMLGGALACILAGGAWLLTHRLGRPEIVRRTIVFSGLCAAWIGALFFVHTFFLQPDFTTLPNGYAIRDDEDGNLLLNPAAQNFGQLGTAEGPDTATDVTRLQLAGPYLLGFAAQLGDDADTSGRVYISSGVFFFLNTKTRAYTSFQDESGLRRFARSQGVALALEPTEAVEFPYRFDAVADTFVAAALLPPAVLAVLGFVWILRLRRRKPHAPA